MLRDQKLLTFLKRVGDLKRTYRACRTEPERFESVAEHTYRVLVMVLLFAQDYEEDIDVLHALKLAIIHDLPEAVVGDVDHYEIATGVQSAEEKFKREDQAMKDLVQELPDGDDWYQLWLETEQLQTPEAKFVKALDRIEAHLTFNEVPDNYSRPDMFNHQVVSVCDHSPAFMQFIDVLYAELRPKMEAQGVEWKEARE